MKNCELSADDVERIADNFLGFKETEHSKIFPNAAFGYWKVTVERPLRLHSQLSHKAIQSLRFASGDEAIRAELLHRFGNVLFTDFAAIKPEVEKALAQTGADDNAENGAEGEQATAKKGLPEKKKKKVLDAKTWQRDSKLVEVAAALRRELGGEVFEDHNVFRGHVDAALKRLDFKLAGSELKVLLRSVSWRVESAQPVVAKVHKPNKRGKGEAVEVDPLHGFYCAEVDGKPSIVEYEPDTELRNTERVPLLEDGGIEAFFRREVLPHVPDAWIDASATKIGYEISFTRYFYKPQPMRTPKEIRADIVALEKQMEGLLTEIIGGDGP